MNSAGMFLATLAGFLGLFGGRQAARPNRAGAKAEAARTVAYAGRARQPRQLPAPVQSIPPLMPLPRSYAPEPTPAKTEPPAVDPKPVEASRIIKAAPPVQVLVLGFVGCEACDALKADAKEVLPTWVGPKGKPWSIGVDGMIRFIDTSEEPLVARPYIRRGESVPKCVLLIDGKVRESTHTPRNARQLAEWSVASATKHNRSFFEMK